MTEYTSIYVHIPFCQKRCSYCDFNTFAGINHLIPAYIEALKREIGFYGETYKNQFTIGTIFFGGGTPSLLDSSVLKLIIEEIKKNFSLAPAAEISLEANPGTVSMASLSDLRNIGFNRISLGVQTTQQRHFDLMERIHNYSDTINANEAAKNAGFDNINIDLIYGLPEQSLEEWQHTLNLVLGLKPQHFSLYALGIEEGTPLKEWVNRGLVMYPDDDLAATMYECATDILEQNNYRSYEISNFRLIDSKNDWRCQHNLQYWRNLPYLGLGAGAHGSIIGKRSENFGGVPEYISRLTKNTANYEGFSPAVENLITIDKFTEMQETIMVGLRLTEEGVSIKNFINRFGKVPQEIFSNEIDELVKMKLIEMENECIHLTKKGILLGNLAFQRFVN